MHGAVVLAAAVATAVLTGALLVGDSVRGSLRDLALERLGEIDDALVAPGFFREQLAEDLPARASAPLILLSGSAVDPGSGARASKVQIVGVDSRFGDLFPEQELDLERADGQLYPSVAVSETLRRELGVEPGQELLLSFGRYSRVPRDSLMGETDPVDLLASQRVTVTRVLPDRGLGRFGLEPHQQSTKNAFLPLAILQRALGQAGRVNALVRARGPAPAPDLRQALELEDLGLELRPGGDHLSLESRELVLRPEVVRAAEEAAERLGATHLGVQTYLINEMRRGELSIPYSMLSALNPLTDPESLRLTPVGDGAAKPGPGGLLLNRWAAEELEAKVGDEVELDYYVVGAREELSEESMTLRLEGVVAQQGLAADRTLTPEYPGLQEVEDMAAWDPPFPVDLNRIRSQDEQYWDDFGATPKGFVAAETGRERWSTRYGSLTSIRLVPVPGETGAEFRDRFLAELRERLPVEAFGFFFRPVREEGLEAARGSSDFSGLFVGFSFFLIVSAAMLIGLLFRLGVEQRAGEVGLLLALGFGGRAVRRRFLAEGTLLAAVGAILGVGLGIAYAALLMWGLRTLWVAAVGSSQLTLHADPLSLVLGFAISVFVILASIAGTLWRLARIPATTLLAGSLVVGRKDRRGPIAPALAWGGAVAGVAMLGLAFASGQGGSPGLAFGTGAAFLSSGLAFFAMWCRGGGSGRALSLRSMAARNSAWNPGRSLLSVALIATAAFLIVSVSSNRREIGEELLARGSASGGFALVADTDIALHHQLGRAADRADLGFSADDGAQLEGVEIYPFRDLPGEDASCLNLYRPRQPRILGAPPELIERGGFSFLDHLELPAGIDSPWQLLGSDLGDGTVPAIADANSAQWILHLGLGEVLEVEGDGGQKVRLRLVALLERSVLQSELLVAESDFLARFPERSGYGFFLVDAPPATVEGVRVLLEDRLERFGFDATTTRERLEAFLQVEHTYLSTFELLGGLGLLLGTVGLAIVLLRNVIERRAELATLRAIGFPARSVVRLILAENFFLLAAGLLIGSLSAVIAVAPALARIDTSWLSLLGTLAAVLVVGMLASTAAVVGALRSPLLPALKEE